MDAIDNPSYFSLPTEVHKKSRHSFFRKWSDTAKSIPSNTPSTKKSSLSSFQPRAGNLKPPLIRANSEDTHLLFLGKPRPSDIVPSVQFNSRLQKQRNVGNVISSNDLFHQDMVYCGGITDDDGDIFINESNKNQYYNTSTLPVKRILTSGRRRHSIGSFLHRNMFINNGAENNENKSKEPSMRKKFKRISNDRVCNKMEDELDILLASCGESEAATLWANYLISCFQQISKERNKPPFKLQIVELEDIILSILANNTPTERCPEARLQIVIICPLFIQKVQNIPETDTTFRKIFHPDKIVAMMLGVQDHGENNNLRTIIPNYDHWRKMTVKDQDPMFVGNFLGIAMDILSRSWRMQETINSEQPQTFFSIIPKKVKIGQNKLIALLTEPLSNEDVVKVIVDKNGQKTEVGVVKRRNPYTLQFLMPGCCLQVSLLVNVYIEKNGKPLGRRLVKCESKMRELDQILRSVDNPLTFMCQTFGINNNDRDQLDSFLLNVFQKNCSPNFNILNPCLPVNKGYTCNEEFPTLLHFTAKYGLEKLSWQLMESAGGEQACQIRNSSYLIPAEIAERANYPKLANILKGYMQMTELSNVYNYLKGISEKEKNLPECNYILPRPLSDTYLIPPAARPVDPTATPVPITDCAISSPLPYYTNFKPCNFSVPANSPTSMTSSNISFHSSVNMDNYEIPRNCRLYTPRSIHTPPTPSSPVEKKFEGYLEMNSIGAESSNFGSVSSFGTNGDFLENFGSIGKLDTCESIPSPSEIHSPTSKFGSANLLSSREKLSPDDELLEIINDFKNNVFTISEVEALVESWQNRNDVQQSFRDKQEQLNKMREEYDRIQRRMKEEMKRTTPFEKIRKFFRRGKSSKSSESNERMSISSDLSISQMRPTSNISLQSSSSTSSACNSTSSANYINYDNGSQKYSEKTSLPQEKTNPKKNALSNNYSEIPHPPKYMDLISNSDYSEYVQPDCTVSKTTRNRLSSCSGSVVNDTIHECNEVDLPEMRNKKIKEKLLNFYQFNNTEKSGKERINEKFKTNSLKIESKNKCKIMKSKVKSVDNLIYDSAENAVSAEAVTRNLFTPKYKLKEDMSASTSSELMKIASQCCELTVCEKLCAETIKCISNVTDNNEDQNAEEEVLPEIKFEFEKSTTLSECGSVNCSGKSSSLDLSSLSLNSNCTIDENGEIKGEQCSLFELQITEAGENETENAPPISSPGVQQNYVNICNFPEYVNVNINSSPAISRNCKYTVVSS